MIEKEIIKDQKETIHRLQDECIEKTKIILKLNQENERLKQSEQEGLEINAELEHYLACMTEQRNKLKLALEEIREMCSNTCEKNKDCIHSCYECKSIDEPVAINRILNKINEVLK